jgi:hypothetical protein
MTISTTKPIPSNLQLQDILKLDFSDGYTYKSFGLGDKNSILVGKSPFVGVQISKTDKEFMIQGAPPTLAGGILSFLLSMIGMGYFQSELKNLEKEVGSFLARKFN